MSRRYDKPWANWFWGPASIEQAVEQVILYDDGEDAGR